MTITNAYLNYLRDRAISESTSVPTPVTFLAWGTSTAAESSTFTQLGTEVGRKQITSYSTGGTGVGDIVTYLGPGDANVNIREVGIFIGAATSTANSGLLTDRRLYSKNKDNLESVQLTHALTFLTT